MKISLYTKPPRFFFKGSAIYYIKGFARYVTHKKRGPDAVLQSLLRSLKIINIQWALNEDSENMGIAHVISNVEALKWAIRQKEKGFIKKLIAGPNLIVMPEEHNYILKDPMIDAILVPSEWVKDFYSSHLGESSKKIRIWPAGVTIPRPSASERKGCIVFKKDVPEDMYNEVITELKRRSIDFIEIIYGKYDQEYYFSLLEKSTYMIYLQKVESQGIALQEAWARDVPTLVWNSGSFTYPTGEIVYGKISAPYQTGQTGLFFKNKEEFSEKFDSFLEHLDDFSPRAYCIENLSDEASARVYVKILESFE